MSKTYHAKHILLEEVEDIDFIKEQLEKGVPFEDLAKEYSECETGANGGNLGRFRTGTMDPDFERALYQMQLNEIRYDVKTKFGHHIILRLA